MTGFSMPSLSTRYLYSSVGLSFTGADFIRDVSLHTVSL
jgi:hypothetical protein